jgi:hypothetical protein
MVNSKFYSNLTRFINNQDNKNANKVIMTELATLLAKNKADFIEVLRGANINVTDNATDRQLIDAFVSNAPSNRKLLLGASFLINHSNQSVGFNGEQELSDSGVKATYKVMYNYFDASNFEDTSDVPNDDFYGVDGEEHSNVVAGLIGGILKGGTDIANKVIEGKHKKQFGASDTLAKQQEARAQMQQTILAQRQQQADNKIKEKELASKKTKTLLIVGGSVLALGIIGVVVYAVLKNRQK